MSKSARAILSAMRTASGLCVTLIDDEGMARRKAQTYGIRAPFRETRRAPFGAPAKRSSSEAIAHQKTRHRTRSSSACSFCGVLNSAPGPAFVLCIMRSSRPEAGSAYAKSSASSWQDLLVGPGGAPLPPGSFVATKPAGAAPHPAFKTPLERAPQLDEVARSQMQLRRPGIVGRRPPLLPLDHFEP